MLSADLEKAIRQALEDATRRGHEFSGLEHLLLALLDDEKTSDVIKHCGGSLARIRGKLESFLDKEMKPVPRRGMSASSEDDDDLDDDDSVEDEGGDEDQDEDDNRAQPTLGFARVVQRAINHV